MKKIKEILGKVGPIAIPMLMMMIPNAAATNQTGISQEEGTIIAAAVFFYLLGAAIIFLGLPQRKEKKIAGYITAIGIALAIMAIIFYFIEFATGWNITFWTKWIDYAGHKTAVLTAAAGAFLIMLATAYLAYQEKNQRRERDIVILGIIAMLVYSIIILFPALTFI